MSKNGIFWKVFLVFTFVGVLIGTFHNVNNKESGSTESASLGSPAKIDDYYTDHIQPILNNRCSVCHSCWNAPCQLKTNSWEGVERGGSKDRVYAPERFVAQKPGRLFLDYETTKQWQDIGGFHSVINPIQPGNKPSLMEEVLLVKSENPDLVPSSDAESSRQCLSSNLTGKLNDKRDSYSTVFKNLGMPFGLPPVPGSVDVPKSELGKLISWLRDGAKGPAQGVDPYKPSAKVLAEVRKWENFFNEGPNGFYAKSNNEFHVEGETQEQKKNKRALVSRYLYEHLFLGNLSFDISKTEFFRLYRKQTKCGNGRSDFVKTNRPIDNPMTARVYYCMKPLKYAVAHKDHIVYPLSDKKMRSLENLFYVPKRTAAQKKKYKRSGHSHPYIVKFLPGYTLWPLMSDEEKAKFQKSKAGKFLKIADASDPFVTYSQIPTRSRYQYLLDDAEYHIRTFIRGPVCKGGTAVNSIDEQFMVVMLDPDADPLVIDSEASFKAGKDVTADNTYTGKIVKDRLLQLPGSYGITIKKLIRKNLKEAREKYRIERAKAYKKQRPSGYSSDDIWYGGADGNPNALLTVFRHFDSSTVRKGLNGGHSKTLFYLDYSLFERLSYALVSTFDPYSNVLMQVYSRYYMGLLRMDAEELAISLLPKSVRQNTRDSWYQGGFYTKKVMKGFPLRGIDIPTSFQFTPEQRRFATEAQKALVDQILSKMAANNIPGTHDPINTDKKAKYNKNVSVTEPNDVIKHLTHLTRIPQMTIPLIKYFPDAIFLRVTADASGENDQVFTIVRNKAHYNVASMFGEPLSRNREADWLTIHPDFWSSYPNRFMVVPRQSINEFVEMIRSGKTLADYNQLMEKFGIHRQHKDFWVHSDWFHSYFKKKDPVQAGLFDYNRYGRYEWGTDDSKLTLLDPGISPDQEQDIDWDAIKSKNEDSQPEKIIETIEEQSKTR